MDCLLAQYTKDTGYFPKLPNYRFVSHLWVPSFPADLSHGALLCHLAIAPLARDCDRLEVTMTASIAEIGDSEFLSYVLAS